MSTRLQEKLAQEIVNDAKNPHPANGKELLVKVGYAENTATRKPGEIIRRKGVIDELKKLGFSEQGADKVVQEILYSKKEKANDRLNAADKVYKRLGSYEDTRQGASKTIVFLPLELIKKHNLDGGTSPKSSQDSQ